MTASIVTLVPTERKEQPYSAQLRASLGLHEVAKMLLRFEDVLWYLATADQKERAIQRAELVLVAYAEGANDAELETVLRGKP